jgi:hypothetical protein
LDDIVSSYDADNRGRIVDVIAEELGDFQVFLTTHDEQFFTMLKDRLSDKGWRFSRLTGWSLETGPAREEAGSDVSVVEEAIASGNWNDAGNAVRRYMEAWLDEQCARYEVHTIHKRGTREFVRTLFDFWDPFIKKIQGMKGGFFVAQVEPRACYERLKSHSMINYYCHARFDPYSWGSMGDVKYVWTEFRDFQKLFDCRSCSRKLSYDRNRNRPYCVCGEAIFDSGTAR